MENEKEATATTATTPEMLSKDNDNVQTIKVLKPKFDTLTTTELKKHVSGLTSKVEPTEHGAILTELLECFKPYDFA